jgi:hypothetical protein
VNVEPDVKNLLHASPVWECVAPSLTIIEAVSDRIVNVGETKDGWSPPR